MKQISVFIAMLVLCTSMSVLAQTPHLNNTSMLLVDPVSGHTLKLGAATLSGNQSLLFPDGGGTILTSATIGLGLPTQSGHSNQFLQTDGAGTLSWASASGGGGVSGLQEFSSTGATNFTVPAGITKILVEMWGATGGGGGGGGGANNGGGGLGGGGGGSGAAGAYLRTVITVTPGDVLTIDIGTGGTSGGGGASGNPGAAGAAGGAATGSTDVKNSTPTVLASAAGGNAGSGGIAGGGTRAGGAAGTGGATTTGSPVISRTGIAGNAGAAGAAAGGAGGTGGAAVFTNHGTLDYGASGTGGAGGSGSTLVGGGGAAGTAGSAGSDGKVVLQW